MSILPGSRWHILHTTVVCADKQVRFSAKKLRLAGFSPSDRLLCMHDEELHKISPGLTEEELAFLKDNLDAYLTLAWEVMQESEVEARTPLDHCYIQTGFKKGRG